MVDRLSIYFVTKDHLTTGPAFSPQCTTALRRLSPGVVALPLDANHSFSQSHELELREPWLRGPCALPGVVDHPPAIRHSSAQLNLDYCHVLSPSPWSLDSKAPPSVNKFRQSKITCRYQASLAVVSLQYDTLTTCEPTLNLNQLPSNE